MLRITRCFYTYLALKAIVIILGCYAVCVLCALFVKAMPDYEQTMLSQVKAIDKFSVFLTSLALMQWVVLTPALMAPEVLRPGPFLEFGLIFVLCMEHEHLAYWMKEIEKFTLEAKYMGYTMA